MTLIRYDLDTVYSEQFTCFYAGPHSCFLPTLVFPSCCQIDQPAADPPRIAKQIESTFDIDCSEVLLCSAKTGQGLEAVLPAIIEKIRPPAGSSDGPLRMLLLDSHYDDYKGVICHVAVVDGALQRGQKIESAATGRVYEVSDVGLLRPEMVSTGRLSTGQVGWAKFLGRLGLHIVSIFGRSGNDKDFSLLRTQNPLEFFQEGNCRRQSLGSYEQGQNLGLLSGYGCTSPNGPSGHGLSEVDHSRAALGAASLTDR